MSFGKLHQLLSSCSSIILQVWFRLKVSLSIPEKIENTFPAYSGLPTTFSRNCFFPTLDEISLCDNDLAVHSFSLSRYKWWKICLLSRWQRWQTNLITTFPLLWTPHCMSAICYPILDLNLGCLLKLRTGVLIAPFMALQDILGLLL